MSERTFKLSLTRRQNYELVVAFDGDQVPDLLVDEAPPLGAGQGPNPAALLGAAVGACLSASLLFCLSKARVEAAGLETTVEGTLVRNEEGRWRVGRLRVRLAPDVGDGDHVRLARCLEVFEDYCIVTESVRAGVPVDVVVEPAVAAGSEGARLPGPGAVPAEEADE